MQIPDDDDNNESSQANSRHDPWSPKQSNLDVSGEEDDDPNADVVMAEDDVCSLLFITTDLNTMTL